jgi:hypothetical protein
MFVWQFKGAGIRNVNLFQHASGNKFSKRMNGGPCSHGEAAI